MATINADIRCDYTITCFFSNAQSITNKFSEFQAIIDQYSPKIIGIAETWCSNTVGDVELYLQGYNLFRNDRILGPGGGVILYIHSDLTAVPCKVLNEVGFENSLWYLISLTLTDKLLVGVVYRSPSSPDGNNQKLLTIISELHESVNFSHLLIMGDFNLPSINWVEYVCYSGENSLTYSFLDATQASYLVQHVTNCTRHRQGQQSSLLDLVFTTEPNAIEEVTHLSPLGSSDHDCLLWYFKCYDHVLSTGQSVPKYNYRKGDYVSMNDYFCGINWVEVLSSSDIQNNWDMFKQIIHGAVASFVPTSVPRIQRLYPPLGLRVSLKLLKLNRLSIQHISTLG